jgi:hypothetical protein
MKEQHRRNDPDPDFFRAKTPRLRFSPPPCYSYPMHYLILVVALLLAADGIWSIVGGVRTLSNKSPDIEHDSESEKRLLSPYTRYWISRWQPPSLTPTLPPNPRFNPRPTG